MSRQKAILLENSKNKNANMKKIVYRGPIFNVEEWKLPKTGTKFARVVGHDAVAVLPILDDGRIIIEKQYRHPLERYLYEIPAGHIDKGETPAAAARRELEEETGYYPKKLKRIFGIFEAPGSFTQFLHVFLAEDLVQKKISRETDEVITTIKISLEKAQNMILRNQICDAKTISSILYYSRFKSK